MSGPSKQLQQQQIDSANKSDALAQQQFTSSQADKARMDTLQQPAIDYNKALASGDKTAIMKAAAQPIGQITRANNTANANILNTLPPGAARDVALAQQTREAPSQIAQFVNSQTLAAPDKLANIGSGIGAFSLQELGGGLRANEDATSGRNQVLNQQAQGKAATLGFLGSLAGAGAGAYAGRNGTP